MVFNKIKINTTVYDCHSYRMGNTTIRTLGVWHVKILSIDEVHQKVLASHEGNPPRWCGRMGWSRWKEKKPILVRSSLTGAYRRQTKEERATMLKEKSV